MKEGQPSQTAMIVALRRFMASLDPAYRPLLTDPDEAFSAWFLEGHSPQVLQQVEALRAGTDTTFLKILRQSAGEAGPLDLLARKRFVEDHVRSALADGAEQMVVFGAGYDVLGLRLAPAFASVRFFELDYPATLAVKRTALESHNALPANLVLLPVDFGHDSADDKLRASPGFRPGARTVFVAEGVLPYLELAAVDALFGLIHRGGGPGSRFVFTYAEEALATKATKALAKIGEPVKFTLEPKDLAGFLKARGFSCAATADHEELRRRYLEPLSLADRPLDSFTHNVVAELASTEG